MLDLLQELVGGTTSSVLRMVCTELPSLRFCPKTWECFLKFAKLGNLGFYFFPYAFTFRFWCIGSTASNIHTLTQGMQPLSLMHVFCIYNSIIKFYT